MYAKMRASIFTCRHFGYKLLHIYIYHASCAPHARARLYYNFISPSCDVIVIYFLYFAMHSSLKCIICASWYRRYPRE